eukprot:1693930-Amphidinium_carterae.1
MQQIPLRSRSVVKWGLVVFTWTAHGTASEGREGPEVVQNRRLMRWFQVPTFVIDDHMAAASLALTSLAAIYRKPPSHKK